MKLALVCMLACSAAPALAADTVRLTTTSGQTVEVAFDQVRQAFVDSVASRSMKAGSYLTNLDGSTTLYQPSIMLGQFATALASGADSALGGCLRFGFTRLVSEQTRDVHAVENVATLTDTGNLASVKYDDKVPELAWVTCAQ